MIVQRFDQGWGMTWGWKKFESEIVDRLLANICSDGSRTVVINSVWYTDSMHQEVISWLRSNAWDRIVLVAMLDAAIPQPSWFAEFNREVIGVGYYPGENEIDLCAMFVQDHIDTSAMGDLSEITQIDRHYMCLNRKPHPHRRKLFDALVAKDLVQSGIVSMGSDDGQAQLALTTDCDTDAIAPNSETQRYGIPNNVMGLGHPDNWRRHFLNVVTETFYDVEAMHFVSEKIYKPILGQRPFLVYAPNGAVNWLEDHGFQSYVDDFSDITDLDLRDPDNLVQFLEVLCQQSYGYLRDKMLALQPKILYNKSRLETYVKQQHQRIQQGLICQI